MTGGWGRLIALLAPERGRAGLAVLLQVLTLAAGVGLMGTSAWLLSKAALHPSIAAIAVAVVGVRAFGICRATLRYLERLASHDVTLRLLARLRVAAYRALVPLAPARLVGRRSGDLLGRVIEDVASLESLYVRVVGPFLAAAALVGLVGLVLLPFGTTLAAAAAHRARGRRHGPPVARRAAGDGPGATPRVTPRRALWPGSWTACRGCRTCSPSGGRPISRRRSGP